VLLVAVLEACGAMYLPAHVSRLVSCVCVYIYITRTCVAGIFEAYSVIFNVVRIHRVVKTHTHTHTRTHTHQSTNILDTPQHIVAAPPSSRFSAHESSRFSAFICPNPTILRAQRDRHTNSPPQPRYLEACQPPFVR
jgi:hypothetical protein